MTLREKQSKFTKMVTLLMLYADFLNYKITFGEAWRHDAATHGHPKSVHKKRLAIDINLFKDGEYITNWDGHDKLHDFWDFLDGARRIMNDPNHYSLEHDGVR